MPQPLARSSDGEASSTSTSSGDEGDERRTRKRRRKRVLIVVAAVLLNKQGQLLLAQRPPGKTKEGQWEFPGEGAWNTAAGCGRASSEEMSTRLPLSSRERLLHVRARACTAFPAASPAHTRPPPVDRPPPALAGGKVDPGEGPEQALVRELQEEVGVQARADALLPITFVSATRSESSCHLLMPIFACWDWAGEPCGAEGQSLAWVSPEQLASADTADGGRYAVAPALRPLLPAVLSTIAWHQRQQAEASQSMARQQT